MDGLIGFALGFRAPAEPFRDQVIATTAEVRTEKSKLYQFVAIDPPQAELHEKPIGQSKYSVISSVYAPRGGGYRPSARKTPLDQQA